MKQHMLLASALVFALFMYACSSTSDTSPTQPASKESGAIQANGAQTEKFEFDFTLTDCDGNLVSGTVTAHVVLKETENEDGSTSISASYIYKGRGYSEDGTKYEVKQNAWVDQYTSADGCEFTGTQLVRLLMTTPGGKNNLSVVLKQTFDYNYCTSVFDVVTEVYEVECK